MGYYSHEECEYVQLYHKDKLSKHEFEEIVINSAAKIVSKETDKNISFQDIFLDVVDDLIKNSGFKKVNFDEEFSIFGWPHITNKEDWEGQRDELLDKLADFIKNKAKNGKIRHKKNC